MGTHNICFCGEIRKYQYFWTEKNILARAMHTCPKLKNNNNNNNNTILLPVDVSESQLANNAVPGQIANSIASDLGPPCLLRPVCPNT